MQAKSDLIDAGKILISVKTFATMEARATADQET